jgi:hypothetical protein
MAIETPDTLWMEGHPLMGMKFCRIQSAKKYRKILDEIVKWMNIKMPLVIPSDLILDWLMKLQIECDQ